MSMLRGVRYWHSVCCCLRTDIVHRAARRWARGWERALRSAELLPTRVLCGVRCCRSGWRYLPTRSLCGVRY
eukprot:2379263-Rhodomonas_salina.2